MLEIFTRITYYDQLNLLLKSIRTTILNNYTLRWHLNTRRFKNWIIDQEEQRWRNG